MDLKVLEETKENLEKLSEPSTAWNFEIDGDPTELAKALGKVLVAEGGVGLAAPQCGIQKTIFIMGNFDEMITCINPIILNTSSDVIMDIEGCLSFPDLWLKVKRPESCKIRYQTVTGEWNERELSGLHARVALHEYDHLLGITFDQRVAELSLSLAKTKRIKENKKRKRNGNQSRSL